MGIPFIPGKTVEVPEISYSSRVDLPAERTALVVVDMQNDFVRDDGGLPVPTAKETIPAIQELLARARSSGVHIAYTQDTQVEDDPELEIWPRHCINGTPGWRIIDELAPHESDLICVKNRYDGFYGTWLDHFCRSIWHVDRLVIVGTVANICVLHTAASAGLRWYDVTVPADGISALTEFDQALTLRQVSTLYAGSVTKSTADIVFT
jgi:nicotinamidase-related amidase